MVTQKGWSQQLMMSLFKKEASYNAGVTMNATNACSMLSYEGEPDWPDTVISDKDMITGYEFGTDQSIAFQGFEFPYKEPRAKPNTIVGLAALTLGALTSTQDGAFTAYRHKITPAAAGSTLPSIQVEHKKGGIQYVYTGVKSKSLKLSGAEREFISIEAHLMGSGNRTTSATAFVASITESWLKLADCKVWLESGANISIGATLSQGIQNISSGTPSALYTRMKSFEFSWDNAAEGIGGFGGGAYWQDIDPGRRKMDLKFSMLFNDSTDLNYFINQNPVAVEFDLKGSGPIAAGGSLYYGVQLVIPKFKLRKAPLAKGGANDRLTVDFECEILDDGTNPAAIIEGYTAKAGYLL